MNSDRDTPDQVRGGLPHSEVPGSPIARISPGLFAACHVLHRLSVPRHPPDALASRLITASPHRRCRTTAAHRAKPHRAKPHAVLPPQWEPAVSMKTLLSDQLGASTACPGPVRLGHITTLSAPFNQPHREGPRRCRAIFSERRAGPASRRTTGCRQRTSRLPGTSGASDTLVEVNGLEPMTSCLQSRRSPS